MWGTGEREQIWHMGPKKALNKMDAYTVMSSKMFNKAFISKVNPMNFGMIHSNWRPACSKQIEMDLQDEQCNTCIWRHTE